MEQQAGRLLLVVLDKQVMMRVQPRDNGTLSRYKSNRLYKTGQQTYMINQKAEDAVVRLAVLPCTIQALRWYRLI
jgi:hypothetical protein